jgi:hypothetical protein
MLCDDDLMLPWNLERKVQVLEDHADVGLVDSAFQIIGPDGQVLHRSIHFGMAESDFVSNGHEFIYRSFAETCRITTFTVMRRSVIEDDRFEEADGPFCDFALFLRLARRTNVAYIAEPLASLRMHAGAETVQAGMQEFRGDSYVRTLGKIALDQRVKKRFLACCGSDMPNVRALRDASRSWARNELLMVIRRRSFPERRRRVTLRLLGQACRIEPSLVISAEAWKLLIGSLVGPAGRALSRHVRMLARAPSRG